MPLSSSVSVRLTAALACLAFAACSRAAPPPAAASSPTGASPAEAVVGAWARSADACARPEFVLRPDEVVIQTDGDGTPVRFDYTQVAWSVDAQGQVTADLHRTHPYGKAPSKTALAFRPLGADEIQLVQRTRPVALHRCAAH